MTQKLKLAGMAAFIGAIAFTSQAQTNVVESVTFALTAYYQGQSVTNVSHHLTNVTQNAASVSIATKDIIKVLGKATANDFSAAAQLLRVTPILNGVDGPTKYIIRDASSRAANIVDVSGFFVLSSTGAAVSTSTSTNNVLITDTTYSTKNVSLVDQAGHPALTAHFNLQGFVVATLSRDVFKNGVIADGYKATWTVNGTGDSKGVPFVIQGNSTISVSAPSFIVGPGY